MGRTRLHRRAAVPVGQPKRRRVAPGARVVLGLPPALRVCPTCLVLEERAFRPMCRRRARVMQAPALLCADRC